ncbi:hypothetical protein [Streptomyces sp. NPDC006477]|uniref:hypothetical protein n=1 Tax=Streptomyces sp. NPDC006477 TaxID=3364747 RepID=UPI00368B9CF2
MADRITIEQLLNLADRAERGPLSAAEASRLRRGLRHLDERCHSLEAARSSTIGRHGNAQRHNADAARRLSALQALVASTRRRGGRVVAVQMADAILGTSPDTRQHDQEAA